MIRINLLPDDRKGKTARRATAPAKGAGGGGGASVMILVVLLIFAVPAVLIFVWSQRQVADAQKQLNDKKNELAGVEQKISDVSEEAKEIQRQRELFSTQLEVLKALDPPKRILWSEKLNMIAKLMPPTVFLSEVEIKEDVKTVPIRASQEKLQEWENKSPDKRGPKPELATKPVISYTMKLSALTTGEDSTAQLNNMDGFYKALTSYEGKDGKGQVHKFMDQISDISFEGFETTIYENQYAVGQFSFIVTTAAVSAEDEEKKEEKPKKGAEEKSGAAPAAGAAKKKPGA